ncbi:winged helix-turn-helix transcriptional regulator [Streptomyces sp. NBC_00063]|uniref:winged helix-turn-helix transcriptional regulator n=1 Tax=Streptomyces sp. NBC_00063 TaxID=2975638 RepID=UPI003D718F3C
MDALGRAFSLLGKRWSGLGADRSRQRPAGFAAIRKQVPGISDRMLTERLRELTGAGLVLRTVLPGPPARSQ